ncbi:MAG TPA: hypothetical protein VLL77_09275 [Anaerolineales bacterium]|nr:hypothetical protein [Anaerolineales bacterium]
MVLGIILAGFVVIAAIGRDYGRSWDEPSSAIYAQRTLRAYAGQPVEEYADLSFYGPAYLAFSEVFALAMERAVPGWTALEGRHAAYFLSFVIAVASVYALARGRVGIGAALVGTLLFATQPLFFGHAFINPKDMPFLGLFAAAMAVGVVAVRSLPERMRSGTREALDVWVRSLAPAGRITGVFLVLVLVSMALAWLSGVLSPTGPTGGLSGPTLPVLWFVAFCCGVWWVLPSWRSHLAMQAGAGLVAGVATAVRVVGPLAGILVSVLLIFRIRRGAIVGLAVYWSALVATACLLWPFLWRDPLGRILESVRVMSRFPWSANTLFAGQLTPAGELPWFYAPAQFGLQLTLPALALGLVGGLLAVADRRAGPLWIETLVFLAWMALPVLAAIAFESVLYDGARQLLFALPPIFVMAAIAVDRASRHVRRVSLRVVLVGLVLSPGIFALASLHPYQYIYYNELAGGVAGAFRRFELDYWGTAYREAMLALDELAPEGADIGVAGPWDLATPYARADMRVRGVNADTADMPDFLLVWTRWNLDTRLWPDAPEAAAVRRNGALLARVVDLRGLKRD